VLRDIDNGALMGTGKNKPSCSETNRGVFNSTIKKMHQQDPNELREGVELYISAMNLQRTDLLSKSDPMACLYYMGSLLGKTETIQNNHNPKFQSRFKLDYYFEAVQKIRIDLYDEDDAASRDNLAKQDFMGCTKEFNLSDVICSVGGKLTLDLMKKEKACGKVEVFAEKVKQHKFSSANKQQAEAFEKLMGKQLSDLMLWMKETPPTIVETEQEYVLKCRGRGLDKKDFFGKSDP